MTESIEDYLKSLVDNQALLDEILYIIDYSNSTNGTLCYYSSLNSIVPYINGLSFLANYTFTTMINMLIPDLFTQCMTRKYDTDAKKLINLKYTCPIYSLSTTGLNDYGKQIQSLSIKTNFQKIIDVNIIKSFLYYNFTSDFRKDISKTVRVMPLERFIEKYIYINQPATNDSKFTDPTVIFSKIYSSDSLLVQLVEFSNKLKEIKPINKNGTNVCPYNIPWLFTYYCGGNNIRELLPYNNFNTDKVLYGMEYSDLNYLSNMNSSLKTLLDNLTVYLSSQELTDILLVSNIFNILDIALEVYSNVIEQISSVLQKKYFVYYEYESPVYLLECFNLFYNYTQNETYLLSLADGNSPEPNNEYIFAAIKNFIDYLLR